MSGALKSHTGVPAKDRARLFDMHVHTTGSADSSIPPWMAVSRARELGLRGLAITDHDRLTVLEPAPLDLVRGRDDPFYAADAVSTITSTPLRRWRASSRTIPEGSS